ncbi:MAG: hypothetical protein M3N53_07150 [Actinomycetota bacterium]|nr:hypothetical protein [Actinomycetota bacterium]
MPATERRSPWVIAGVIVLGVRVVFFALAYVASFLLSGDTQGLPERGPFDMWVNWDATRFLVTADLGYEGPGSFTNSYAFFPFFPLAIRALGFLGIPSLAAGLLVSAVSSWIAFTFLLKLADEELGQGTGRRAVLYLALFPTGVFLIAPYSEALFLAGAVPAFYMARRGRWDQVGLPAAIAMGSRFAGVFLLFGLLVEFLRQRDFSAPRNIAAATSLLMGTLPLLGYGAFLALTKGDALYFFTEQRLGWGRAFVGPVNALRNTIDRWDDPTQSTNFLVAYRFEVVAGIAGTAFVVWALNKKEWGYAAYMGSMLAVLLTSTEYFSVPRILLSFFPAALFMAQLTLRFPKLHESYLMVTSTVAAVGVVVYTRGAWFF